MPKNKKNAQNNLLEQLRKDYPDIIFEPGDRYIFHPPNTIFFVADSEDYLLLLHELGHALIGKTDYNQDIELLRIESEAWAKAAELCDTYHLDYDNDRAQDSLDSYRDLLHHNSLCQSCNLNGYQDDAGAYHCPLCGATWRGKYKAE